MTEFFMSEKQIVVVTEIPNFKFEDNTGDVISIGPKSNLSDEPSVILLIAGIITRVIMKVIILAFIFASCFAQIMAESQIGADDWPPNCKPVS